MKFPGAEVTGKPRPLHLSAGADNEHTLEANVSQQTQYRVAKGALKIPRTPKGQERKFVTASDFILQGSAIPEGMLSQPEIEGLLKDGRIEPLTQLEAQQAAGLPKRRGPWSVDPANLAGKSLEELVLMVLDIDEGYDVAQLENAGDAVRQLTADWDPAFRDELSRSTDKSRPERLRTSGAKDKGLTPMSEAAEAALARAKERAAGESQGS